MDRGASKLVRWGAVAAFFCALIALLALLRYVELRRATDFYANSLKELHVSEHVVVSGNDFTVADGVVTAADGSSIPAAVRRDVLALAYKKAVARHSPIMNLAGVDTDHMRTIAQSLRASEQKLAAAQDNAGTSDRVAQIFPVDYLKQLAATEDARKKFLETGSDADARVYDDSLAELIHVYRRSLLEYRNNFSKTVSDNRSSFVSGTLIADKASTLRAVDILEEHAAAAQHRISQRRLCTLGYIRACDAHDLAVPDISVPNSVDHSGSDGSDEVLRIGLIRRDLGFTLKQQAANIRILQSACVMPGWNITPYFGFAAETVDFHGVPYARPALVSDVFLMSDEKYSNLPFFEKLASLGMHYVPAQPLSHYKCIGLNADLGTLASVWHTALFSRSAHLSSYSSGAQRSRIQSLESRLSMLQMSEVDARMYLHEARSLAVAHAVPEDTQHAIIDLLVEFNSAGVGTFTAALDTAYLTETTLRLNTEGIPTDLSGNYLYYTRSGFPTLYMHAYGETDAAFQKNTLSPKDQPYMLLSELAKRFPNDPELKAEITHDLTEWRTLHAYEQ